MPGSRSEAPNVCTADELRELGLFAALSQPALEHLLGRMRVTQVFPRSFVFQEGQAGTDLFVLLAGEMEVLKRRDTGRDARIALLGPGNWFGEMSVVDISARSTSVRATATSRLLHVTAADLDSLYRTDLKAYSLVVLNIARELSRKLRTSESLLANQAVESGDS